MTNFDVYEEISKLAELREKGVLTEEEFEKRKSELLAGLSSEVKKTHIGQFPTWEAFIESEAVANALEKNEGFYGEKFRKIVEKVEVGNLPIVDKASLKKVSPVLSWNWPGFLFFVFWAAYRGLEGWALYLGIYCAVVIFSAFIPGLENAVWIISFVFGLLGNALILVTLAKRYAVSEIKEEFVSKSRPSWRRAAIAVAAALVAIVIMLANDSETASLFSDEAINGTSGEQGGQATADAWGDDGSYQKEFETEFKASFRKSFAKSCENSSYEALGNRANISIAQINSLSRLVPSTCACAAKRLVEKYSVQELTDLSQNREASYLASQVKVIMDTCFDEVNRPK